MTSIGKEIQSVARHGLGLWAWGGIMLLGGAVLIAYWITPESEILRLLASVAVPATVLAYFVAVAAIAARKRKRPAP